MSWFWRNSNIPKAVAVVEPTAMAVVEKEDCKNDAEKSADDEIVIPDANIIYEKARMEKEQLNKTITEYFQPIKPLILKEIVRAIGEGSKFEAVFIGKGCSNDVERRLCAIYYTRDGNYIECEMTFINSLYIEYLKELENMFKKKGYHVNLKNKTLKIYLTPPA